MKNFNKLSRIICISIIFVTKGLCSNDVQLAFHAEINRESSTHFRNIRNVRVTRIIRVIRVVRNNSSQFLNFLIEGSKFQ